MPVRKAHKHCFENSESTVCEQGELAPGELMFTPSRCAHAVQNLELSIALTSNYVDLSNVVDVSAPCDINLMVCAAD